MKTISPHAPGPRIECGVTGRVIPHRDAESRNTRAEISHLGRFLARTSF